MDKKLRKNILEILRKNGAKINLYHIKKSLVDEYLYSEEIISRHDFSSKVEHILSVLEGDLLIKKYFEESPLIGCGMDWDTYFELTAKGYCEFNSWYQKMWKFFQGPFITILTIINTIVSIVAVIIGWILIFSR